MEKIKIDIKTIILIITATCVMAGLYYTMESRVHSAEMEMKFVKGQLRSTQADIKWLKRAVNKMKKEKTQ